MFDKPPTLCNDGFNPSTKTVEDRMSLQAHLGELHAKHKALEAELADAINHPASSDAEIAELKRKKLKLKDEISRLEHQHAA
jgi:hypothetical protein